MKKEEKERISVIICAYSSKRVNMTIECISSIINNTYKNYEIILVIDGNHELKQVIESNFKTNMTIIENEKNEGPAISRNRGVEQSQCDIVAFIDDDGIASPKWLENIAKTFDDYPEILVIGGKLLPIYPQDSTKLPEEILWLVGGTYKGYTECRQTVRNVFTGNMAARKKIFDEFNFELMFDNKKGLTHQLEDTFFCVNINNKYPESILYNPDIIAYHHVTRDKLKLFYIIKRSFSEGILKSKLKHINESKTKVLHDEHNYLSVILKSIINNFLRFKFRDGLLSSCVVSNVLIGYASYTIRQQLKSPRPNVKLSIATEKIDSKSYKYKEIDVLTPKS